MLTRLLSMLRRAWFRALPLSWLKRERTELLNYKMEVLHEWPRSVARDVELEHVQGCLDDSLRVLEQRRAQERLP